ncbi:hypothetical protein [Microbacterium elymi]|uniref:MFS transporter n=1 Tax=Microbacterium elymi TaxID=2909587 RepID=A0ABY5NJF6_9MICO|nr:hypothetical protein [Microbacterium elymi]UUT35302.1 hypothetical protein L2X98_34605 [Microbacterium elymi]
MAVASTGRADDTRLTPTLIKLAIAVIVGTFAVQMDATMVNVALESMRSAFDASVSAVLFLRAGATRRARAPMPLDERTD